MSNYIYEIVGIFDDEESFKATIDELLSSGFDRASLGLLATEKAVEEKLGHKYQKSTEAEDDPEAPRVAYVSKESIGDAEGAIIGTLLYVPAVATTGALVASGAAMGVIVAATALAGGAGALIGSILAAQLGQHHSEYIQEELDRGGIVLWVRLLSPEEKDTAKRVFKKYSAHDVHVHNSSP